MRCYKLNEYSVWSALPWQIIKMRIFILQKQIYQASKICNILLMHKWQNVLLNSNEAKLIAIDIISNYILQYYSTYNSIKYSINDRLKFFLFHNIYTTHDNSLSIKNLLELIKQYIIYLCLNAEWEAKFEPLFQQEFNYQKICLYQKKLTNSIKLINKFTNKTNLNDALTIKLKIDSKYLNKSYLVQKIQPILYIKYCLDRWLDNNFINNILFNLSYKVLFAGTEWFNMKYTELKLANNIYTFSLSHYIYHNIYNMYFMKVQNDIKYIFDLIFLSLKINRNIKDFYNRETYKLVSYKSLLKQNKGAYLLYDSFNLHKLFIEQIKSIIYKQNVLDKWRIQKHFKLSKIISLFINKYTEFYKFFCLFLNINTLLNIEKVIINYLTLWLKKKYVKYTQSNMIIKSLIKRQLLLNKQQILNHIYFSIQY